ncbi:MAG: trigger factor [Fimbriimonadaceae bacterium]
MQITREDLNPCTVKLTIVCDPAEVKDGFSRAFKTAAKNVRIPGFRPGTAPRHLVEKQVNPDALTEVAVEEIVKTTWKKAADQENIKPFNAPAVEVKKINREDEVCEYEIKIPLEPVVELADYKGLKADRPKIDVTEEEVEAQIEHMRRDAGKREKVTDRGAEEGDVAVVNIRVDGEEGDGRTFMVIVGQTFAGLDKVLTGMEAEDMKRAELKFPESFQEADWRKKKLSVLVTLRSIGTMKLPELDDEFAKTLNIENVEEMRNRIKEAILVAKKEQSDNFVNEQLLDGLVHGSTIHVPDSMWEQVAQQRLQDMVRVQQERQKSLEDLATEYGKSLEDLANDVKNESKTFVLRAQAIQTIFTKEEMKISDEDLNQELFLMSREYRMEAKILIEELQKNNSTQELVHRSINRKVMNLLNAHAEINEIEVK